MCHNVRVIDNATGLNVMRTDVLYSALLESTPQSSMNDIKCASGTKLDVYDICTRHLQRGDSRTCATLGILNSLAVLTLLVMNFIKKLLMSMQSAKKKTVPHHFPLVFLLMVQEAGIRTGKRSKENKYDIYQEEE